MRPLDPVKGIEWPWRLDMRSAQCTLEVRDRERCLVHGTVAGHVSDGGSIRVPEDRCGWSSCSEAIRGGDRACRIAVAMAQHGDDSRVARSCGSVAPDGLGVAMIELA